jgi:hypothetical protein
MEVPLTPEMIRDAAPETGAMPTPLTDRELGLLRRILGVADVPGVEQLRDQVRGLQVAPGSDATCRIYLAHPDMPRAAFGSGERTRLPGRYLVRSPQGHLIGEVVVWVEQGLVRALQFVRHDEQPALTLPPAAWLELPDTARPDSKASALVLAAQQGLTGVRALMAPEPTAVAPTSITAASATRSWIPRIVGMLLALCVLALATMAFATARSSGADLDAARAAGTRAGTAAGTRDGATMGTFAGSIEGELAGRMSTYAAARRNAVLAAQRAARRKAAADLAAARAAAYPNPSTCIGYWATDTTWACS